MNKEFIFTETMQRVCRDAQHVPQVDLWMPLLWAARGAEVLAEWGYDPVPMAGSVTWIIGRNVGDVYALKFAAARAHLFKKGLAPMHCWIYERSCNVTIDFSTQYLKAQCSFRNGVCGQNWTCPVTTEFYWQHEDDTLGSYYEPDETAAVLAARHWARLVAGPLRWQLDCPECGLLHRDGRWVAGSRLGRRRMLWEPLHHNEKAWTGKRAQTVCPGCRLDAAGRRAA